MATRLARMAVGVVSMVAVVVGETVEVSAMVLLRVGRGVSVTVADAEGRGVAVNAGVTDSVGPAAAGETTVGCAAHPARRKKMRRAKRFLMYILGSFLSYTN